MLLQEIKVCAELLVSQVLQVPMDHLALQVPQDLQGPTAYQEFQDYLVVQDLRGSLAFLENPETQ